MKGRVLVLVLGLSAEKCGLDCRKAKAIDFMVVDILKAANPVLKITSKVWDPRKFVTLDDTILKKIEHYRADELVKHGLDDLDDSHIAAAQHILRRLRNRELYRYCGECIIPAAYSHDR